MKTWKKPEVLNLMLQETKDGGAATIPYDNHICKQTGKDCEKGNNNTPNPDTCALNHGSLQYTEDGRFLVSCCS